MHAYACVVASVVSWLSVTLWTVACQTLCPWGFSRQENWSGFLCPPPVDLPDPGIEPYLLCLPCWQAGSPLSPPAPFSTFPCKPWQINIQFHCLQILLPHTTQLSYCFIVSIAFFPVSNNMFLISFRILTRNFFNIHISTNILFMMICYFLRWYRLSLPCSWLPLESSMEESLTFIFLPIIFLRQSGFFCCCSELQLLSHVQLFATPWTAARQAPLSSTVSQSLLRFMSQWYDPWKGGFFYRSPKNYSSLYSLSSSKATFIFLGICYISTPYLDTKICINILGLC